MPWASGSRVSIINQKLLKTGNSYAVVIYRLSPRVTTMTRASSILMWCCVECFCNYLHSKRKEKKTTNALPSGNLDFTVALLILKI